MDKDILTSLESFDRVWSRVSAPPGPPSPDVPTGDAERLCRLMEGEARSIAFYMRISRMSSGTCRSMALRHLAEERSHLRVLQTEYFLLRGDSWTPPTVQSIKKPLLSTLREIWLGEQEGAAAYTAAALATENAALAELYTSIAADETRHAGALRRLIGQAV